MRKKKKINYIAILMTLTLILSGCIKNREEVPKLLSPLINNQSSFRQVEYGKIGGSTIKIASIFPEEYCHFVRGVTTISEIVVDVGEYVEKGAVLATVDVAEYQREIDKKNAEITCKQRVNGYKEKLYQEQIREQKYKKKACNEAGDKTGAKECEVQISIIEENKRYDTMLYRHQVTVLKEEIVELNEYVEEGTIKARHTGYVTYLKDFEKSSVVESFQNIVIVSDYDKLHLELDEDLSSQFYKSMEKLYNNIYIEINGKEQEVELYPYTSEQLVAIQKAGAYPKIRLEMKGMVSGMEPGGDIPVYFKSGTGEGVLKIGTDSLYQDEEQYFVYVKNGEKKEKREIKIGKRSTKEVEVLSGLNKGEWVLYSSSAAISDEYEEYKVEKKDFNVQVKGGELGYRYDYTKKYTYGQENKAIIKSVNVQEDDVVKKGDLICVLDTGEGVAGIKEVQSKISNLKIDYDRSKEEYNKQIDTLTKEIKNKKKRKGTEKQQETEESGQQTDADFSGKIDTEQTEIQTKNPEAMNPLETVQTPTTEIQATETTENQTEKMQEPDSKSSKEQNKEKESFYNYALEQMESQKKVLTYQKKIMEEEYNYNQGMLQKEYEQMVKNNDGTGKISVYADHDGVIGKLDIYEGTPYDPEYNNYLFQIYDEASKKITVDTGKDYIGAGSQTDFTDNSDSSKTYKGKVVGNSAIMDRMYLSEVNEKVYVTSSLSSVADDSGAVENTSAVHDLFDGRNKAYVVIDDSSFYEKEEVCNVSYSKAKIQNAVTLPVSMVYEEAGDGEKKYYFVWKIVDGELVKQYVETSETLMTATEMCILEGLEDGDIVAKQKQKEE